MYRAYITQVTNIRPAENADRLNACEVFGNTTIIDKSITEDDTIVYFPSDGQISVEFGEKNNLFRRKDDAGNNVGGFIDPVKRNITAIRLRGNRSDGLVLPLSCLNYCFAHGDASIELRVGDVIDGCVNGHDICTKYIPRRPDPSRTHGGNKTRKHKTPVAPLFKEHADTEQLAYNLSAFKPGDEIEITLKMHGTSQRTGYLPTLKGYKKSFLDWLLRREGKPIYDWGYVSGTRRVVLEDYEGGYYGDNAFREQHSKIFEGKLWKGETCYYEVVSFTNNGTPIMGCAKVPKEAQSQYGKEMIFHYGLTEGSDLYVYRMTMTNEDGDVIEYTPDFMRYSCEHMGVKCVPVFAKVYVRADAVLIHEVDGDCWGGGLPEYGCVGDGVLHAVERYYDGPDPIGKTHVREGVVVRIINRPKFTAYKHKNFLFKQISGIIVNNVAGTNTAVDEEILSEI